MVLHYKNLFKKSIHQMGMSVRMVHYVQGQEPEPKIREYFYYIDHQGMEKKFLRFFFNQLRINTTDRYKEFPYVSLCGKERNYVRCDDYPFVFTHMTTKEDTEYLAHNHAGDLLSLKFEPEKIFMLPETGRVYHPAPKRAGLVGLVRSKLAIELSKQFIFEKGENNPPTHFSSSNGTIYKLDTSWFYETKKLLKSV